MRFLFIVQGEGRGHLTQAIVLSEILRNNGHEVVEVLVGCSKMRKIPGYFFEQAGAPVYAFQSPNFIKTADNKHFLIFRSIVYNLKRERRKAYFKSIRIIRKRIQGRQLDAVVNFYDLLGGLAYRKCRMKAPMICVAHQFVFEHPDYVFAHRLSFTQHLLRLYSRLCSRYAHKRVALSFDPLVGNAKMRLFIAPPLLRRNIPRVSTSTPPYWLGYILNHGFSEEIIDWHKKNSSTIIHVFWDKPGAAKTWSPHANLFFHQLDDKLFVKMMAGCAAFFGTAGFESICEAMYMNKPMLIVPAHAEQQLNADDAARTGRVVVAPTFDLDKLVEVSSGFDKRDTRFQDWARQAESFWKEIWFL